MRLLLTSAGVKNASIRAALVDLLGKPISEANALCIPTASYGHPEITPSTPWRFIAGKSVLPMCDLGWRSVGILELTALPTIPRERWVRWVREADALLVNGGDTMYLCHWMRQSGLAELLSSLDRPVWVGLSAGSMALTPRVGEAFLEAKPPITGNDLGLAIVEFAIFPHMNEPGLPENTMACAEVWAAGIGGPAYAIDDQTAIKVIDGQVDVVSEGHWRFFEG